MEYDEIFTQIAGRAGSLDKTLDAFFGFLNRRTDLYVTFNEEQKNARMGFPEGIAEQMVLRSMRKFPYRPLDNASSSNGNINGNNDSKVKDSKIEKDNNRSNQSSASPSPSSSSSSSSIENDRNKTVFNVSNDKPSLTNNSNSSNVIKYTDDGKQIPIGNGGVTERYNWTQTLNEISIHIGVPLGTRSKDVSCIIKTSSMLLKVNDVVILQGSFEREVHADESMWTLDTTTHSSNINESSKSETCVVLNLEKRVETWWKSILVGEPEIDTTKVDSSRKINEYDEQTQASIRKIMYEQQQKRLGLATQESAEDKTASLLEKAKLAPGSPFL